jgi:hypothetical protein
VTPIKRETEPYGATMACQRALQLQPFSEMTMRAHGMRKTIKTVWLSHATTYPLEYLSVAQPAALSQSLTV